MKQIKKIIATVKCGKKQALPNILSTLVPVSDLQSQWTASFFFTQ